MHTKSSDDQTVVEKAEFQATEHRLKKMQQDACCKASGTGKTVNREKARLGQQSTSLYSTVGADAPRAASTTMPAVAVAVCCKSVRQKANHTTSCTGLLGAWSQQRCRGQTLAQHVPALLSMQAPKMPAATKAREQAAGHGAHKWTQLPNFCTAYSSTFVDAGTRDACGNKSGRKGSRAWLSQMDAGGQTLVQHVPALLSMKAPEMPAATKAREQAAGHGACRCKQHQ